MRRLGAILGAAVLTAWAIPAAALEVTAGKVVRVDRENQLVTLHTGEVFYLTNRAFMSRFVVRPRATFWYRVEDGVNVVVTFNVDPVSPF